MGLLGGRQPLLGPIDAKAGLPERSHAVGPVQADLLAERVLDQLERAGGGRVGARGRRRPLQVLLQLTGIFENLEHLSLPDTGCGQEGAAVQPKPAGAVGRAVEDDFAGDVAPELHINRGAVDPGRQVLLDLDPAAVGELDLGRDRPVATLPRSKLGFEVGVNRPAYIQME